MSQHHDESHHGGHGGGGATEWVSHHMGGIIMPFGQAFEGLLERVMYFIVNGYFMKAATIYFFVFSPILLLEFIFRYAGL